MQNLQTLDIGWNRVDQEVARVLVSHQRLLTELYMDNTTKNPLVILSIVKGLHNLQYVSASTMRCNIEFNQTQKHLFVSYQRCVLDVS